MDPKVHAYVSTGLANSKFGIRNSHLQVLRALPTHPGLLYVALWQARMGLGPAALSAKVHTPMKSVGLHIPWLLCACPVLPGVGRRYTALEECCWSKLQVDA